MSEILFLFEKLLDYETLMNLLILTSNESDEIGERKIT